MIQFFEMGGYAPFVWSAYGITLLVVLLNVWYARRARLRPLERTEEKDDVPSVRRRPVVRQVQ